MANLSGVSMEHLIEHSIKVKIQDRLFKANTDLEKLIGDYNDLVHQLKCINHLISYYDKVPEVYKPAVYDFIREPEFIETKVTHFMACIIQIKKSIDRAKNSDSFKLANEAIENIVKIKNEKFDKVDQALEKAREALNA